eukprot:IDg15840t1
MTAEAVCGGDFLIPAPERADLDHFYNILKSRYPSNNL